MAIDDSETAKTFYSKTILSFQVVAFFITTSLTADDINEALSKIKSWNPMVSPVYSMTDCDQGEIKALKEVFPSIKETFYCDFHVKQAWRRHIKSILADHTRGLFKFKFD